MLLFATTRAEEKKWANNEQVGAPPASEISSLSHAGGPSTSKTFAMKSSNRKNPMSSKLDFRSDESFRSHDSWQFISCTSSSWMISQSKLCYLSLENLKTHKQKTKGEKMQYDVTYPAENIRKPCVFLLVWLIRSIRLVLVVLVAAVEPPSHAQWRQWSWLSPDGTCSGGNGWHNGKPKHQESPRSSCNMWRFLTPCNYCFIVSRAGTQKHNKLTIGNNVMRIGTSLDRNLTNYLNCKTASLQQLYHISRASCDTRTQPNATKARRGGGGIVWWRRCRGEGGANGVPTFLATCTRKVKGHAQGTQKKLRKIMRPIWRRTCPSLWLW